MNQKITITCDIPEVNTLAVYVNVPTQKEPSGEAVEEGILLLSVRSSDTGEILQEESFHGKLPLACSSSLHDELDARGGSYAVTALWTPSDNESDRGGHTGNVYAKAAICISPVKEIVSLSCSYTMISQVMTGQPVGCFIRDTCLTILPGEGYRLIGNPKDAEMSYHPSPDQTIAYPHTAIGERQQILFPDVFPVKDDSQPRLPLSFCCTVMLQQADNPDFTRLSRLTYRAHEACGDFGDDL